MSMRPDAEFATKIVIDDEIEILHTSQRWDHRALSFAGYEPAPSDLSDAIQDAVDDIVEQATQDGVSLNWRTARWSFTDRPADNRLLATLSVDVL